MKEENRGKRTVKKLLAYFLMIAVTFTMMPLTSLSGSGNAYATSNPNPSIDGSGWTDTVITSGNTTWYNNYRYVVDRNVTISHPVIIAGGATVVLDIRKNCALTVDARNYSGQAGIYLPSNSTLLIVGEGTLNAYGGNGGSGAAGSNGNVG